MRPRVACGAALVLAAACGGAASDLTPKEAAAERAYAAGRYDEAAARFGEAAQASPRARDREEARYREAMSFERAARPREARAVLAVLLKEFPRGERAPRAAYDAAVLDIEAGRADAGYPALDALLRTHPDSGPAPAALRRYLDFLAPHGEAAIQGYLDGLAPAVAKAELAQYVGYERARSLERSGAAERAHAAYLELADRYPYPRGVFWDDALYRAAELDAARGAPLYAIQLLERMLREREPSFLQGSYERGRYGQAQFRVAELYRDALHDRDRAREAFERLFASFPTSLLRDDAAWNAALLAVEAGDSDGACKDLRPLVAGKPESRYAACASTLCPALRPSPNAGRCHEYLLRPRR